MARLRCIPASEVSGLVEANRERDKHHSVLIRIVVLLLIMTFQFHLLRSLTFSMGTISGGVFAADIPNKH